MMRTRKLIIPAVTIACALALGAGCVTEQGNNTVPPYATISDEDRDPANAPRAANTDTGDSGGVMSTLGDAIMWPFRAIGNAFSTK
jgi:hypothetical protein